MKKILTTVLFTFSTLFAQEITVEQGWNLLGALDEIPEMATFDTHYVSSVWIYKDGSWGAYRTSGGVITYPTMSSIDKQQGYWLNAREDTTIQVLEKFTTYDESTTSITLPSTKKGFYLELAANASTGYDWSVESYDSAVFAEPVAFTLQESDVVGSSSTKRYLFKLLDGVSGMESNMKLIYKRSWEESAAKELGIAVNIE